MCGPAAGGNVQCSLECFVLKFEAPNLKLPEFKSAQQVINKLETSSPLEPTAGPVQDKSVFVSRYGRGLPLLARDSFCMGDVWRNTVCKHTDPGMPELALFLLVTCEFLERSWMVHLNLSVPAEIYMPDPPRCSQMYSRYGLAGSPGCLSLQEGML